MFFLNVVRWVIVGVLIFWLAQLAVGGTFAHASTPPMVAKAQPCGAEDDPTWVWYRCGDGQRGVVTVWGTPKVVRCAGFRWLVRHGDLDPHTPRLKGDHHCGRK